MPIEFTENDIVSTSSPFFKFDKIGDNVIGTYIKKELRPNNMRPGEDQAIYTLLKEDGSKISVGGRAILDNQMDAVKLGQIIKIAYTEDKKIKGKVQAMKIIRVYARPDLINEEWLASQSHDAATTSVEVNLDDVFSN